MPLKASYRLSELTSMSATTQMRVGFPPKKAQFRRTHNPNAAQIAFVQRISGKLRVWRIGLTFLIKPMSRLFTYQILSVSTGSNHHCKIHQLRILHPILNVKQRSANSFNSFNLAGPSFMTRHMHRIAGKNHFEGAWWDLIHCNAAKSCSFASRKP